MIFVCNTQTVDRLSIEMLIALWAMDIKVVTSEWLQDDFAYWVYDRQIPEWLK